MADTLHYTEAAESECGRIILAHDDLPLSGTHGRNLLGFISELRARAVPYDAIAGIINALAGRHVITKASVIAAYNRTADSLRPESERRLDNVRKSRTAGADETHSLAVYMRLTAAYVEHLLVVEYMRTSLATMAGGSAYAALRVVEECGYDGDGDGDGDGCGYDGCGAAGMPAGVGAGGAGQMPALPAPAALPALPAVAEAAAAPTAVPAGRSPGPAGRRAPGGAAAAPAAAPAGGGEPPLSSVMCEILSAAALSASRPGEGGFDEAQSGAIAGITLGILAAATKDALVGTKAGAKAEAAWQDGSPNGIGWVWVFQCGTDIVFRLSLTRGRETFDRYMKGFSGILTSDKYAVYAAALDQSMRQAC